MNDCVCVCVSGISYHRLVKEEQGITAECQRHKTMWVCSSGNCSFLSAVLSYACKSSVLHTHSTFKWLTFFFFFYTHTPLMEWESLFLLWDSSVLSCVFLHNVCVCVCACAVPAAPIRMFSGETSLCPGCGKVVYFGECVWEMRNYIPLYKLSRLFLDDYKSVSHVWMHYNRLWMYNPSSKKVWMLCEI